MKNLLFKAGILAAATASFGFISPAQAADPVSCDTGGLGGANVYNPSTLTAPGFSCFIGDKVYKDFTGFAGISGTSIFTFTTSGPDHTFQGTGLNYSTIGTPFTYGYTVALYNAVAGQEFKSFVTDASGSNSGSPFVYSKALSTNAPAPGSGPSNSSNIGTGNIVQFAPGQTADVVFASTLTVTSGTLTGVTDTLSQKFGPTAETPGPLPLLGAGAAFGFSRRLRSRIKKVA